MKSSHLFWPLIVLASIVLISTVPPATKILNQAFPPFLLGSLRYLTAWLTLAVFVLSTRRNIAVKPKDLIALMLLGILGNGAFALTLIFAVKFSPVSFATILLNTQPFFVLFLVALLDKRRPNLKQIIAVIFGIIGIVIIYYRRGFDFTAFFSSQYALGNLIALGGSAAFALYTVLSKYFVKRIHSFTMNFWGFLGTWIFCLIASLLAREWGTEILLQANYISLLLFVGIVPSTLVFLIWTESLKHISPTLLATYRLLIPVIVAVISYFFLSEQITLSLIIGLPVILVSMYVVQKEEQIKS